MAVVKSNPRRRTPPPGYRDRLSVQRQTSWSAPRWKKSKTGGRNNLGHHYPSRRWWPQTALPQDRFRWHHTASSPGLSASSTTPTATAALPHRLLRRWRAPLHHRAQRIQAGDVLHLFGSAHQDVGNCLLFAKYPGRLAHPRNSEPAGKGAQMARSMRFCAAGGA